MAGQFLRHDQDVSQAHAVDSIHGMGATNLEGSEAMTVLVLLAVLFILAFVLGACRIGTGDGVGGGMSLINSA